MLKAKKVIKQLRHIKGSKFFGVYEVKNNTPLNHKGLNMSPIPMIKALAPFEFDFKKKYGVDFDDVIYEGLEGNYKYLEITEDCGNSYNWGSAIIFNFQSIEIDGETYWAIKWHMYGDVRGNYTDYIVLNISDWELWGIVADSTRVMDSVYGYQLDTDTTKEAGVYNVYNEARGVDVYDLYIDFDEARDSKREILKAIKGALNV